MAEQKLAPSKTPLYIKNRKYMPPDSQLSFLRALAKVKNWDYPLAVDVEIAFHWRETPQGHAYWSAWCRFLRQARIGNKVYP